MPSNTEKVDVAGRALGWGSRGLGSGALGLWAAWSLGVRFFLSWGGGFVQPEISWGLCAGGLASTSNLI